MSKQSEQKEKQPCPEFPFFGATYPDARCIAGYLWDLDRCNEKGELYGGGNIPCPFCNTEEFIEYDPLDLEYAFLPTGVEEPTPEQINEAKRRAKEDYIIWIDKLRKRYATRIESAP